MLVALLLSVTILFGDHECTMHTYHYPLFESGAKTRCEQLLYVEKRQNYYVNTTNNSKIQFPTTIINILLAMES